MADGRITLLSYHGKYVSAQPDGRIEVNRNNAKAWEIFKLEEGKVPVKRRISDTDYAASLAGLGGVGLQGHHGFYVSANATCQVRSLDSSEVVTVIKVGHNVVAFRSRFGKYLSGE